MAYRNVLADSSYLFTSFNRKDSNYKRAFGLLTNPQIGLVVPQVVLTEFTWLLNRAGGPRKVAEGLRLLTLARLQIAVVTDADLLRTAQLLDKYAYTKIDFVDCAIVALAERLDINAVATFDLRDFTILRTARGTMLEILPEPPNAGSVT